MREYQLCGLGNALVDIFVELSDEEFASLGFERGTMRLVEVAEQKLLLDRFKDREPRLVSGGSVANSTIAFARRSSFDADNTRFLVILPSKSLHILIHMIKISPSYAG